jgi:hypothetical protein
MSIFLPPDRSLALEELKALLKDEPPRYRYVWRVPDPKNRLQGKHRPSQWEVHQARVRARLGEKKRA